MSRNIRLPGGFADWVQYEDRYRVDVIPEVWVMRCRQCRTEWAIPHNRGKMLQRAHVCPNACNGKPRTARGGQPPMLRARLEELRDWRGARDRDRHWEEDDVREDWWEEEARAAKISEGRERRRRTKLWHTFKQAGSRPQVSSLLHDLAERGTDLGDDSFLDALDAYGRR